MQKTARFIVLLCMMLYCMSATAVVSVTPNTVTVSSTGVNRALLVFNGTLGQQAVDAFWCGQISAPPNTPLPFDPCVPGTLFGSLPRDLAVVTTFNNGLNSFTSDVMTMPASVARRAYQAASSGQQSTFFYVRRFVNGVGISEYIAVTLRLSAGFAGAEFSLKTIKLKFAGKGPSKGIYTFARDDKLPAFGARILYNGSGRIRGRWEVIKVGNARELSQQLLRSTGPNQVVQILQTRFTEIGRFDTFLPPTGSFYLPGPDASKLPKNVIGDYIVVLLIEGGPATFNALAASLATFACVPPGVMLPPGSPPLPDCTSLGAFAQFIPVLRYYIGDDSARVPAERGSNIPMTLHGPVADSVLPEGMPLRFSWLSVANVRFYRLEIWDQKEELLSAIIDGDNQGYFAPSWLKTRATGDLRWRVSALDANGVLLAQSEWRNLRIAGGQ